MSLKVMTWPCLAATAINAVAVSGITVDPFSICQTKPWVHPSSVASWLWVISSRSRIALMLLMSAILAPLVPFWLVPLVEDRRMVLHSCAMTEKTRKARVTDENRAEAEALKKLYFGEPHNGRPGGMTQAAFGTEYGIGAQSVVWQYLNGTIPLNLRAATGFARGLNVKLADFSPRLAKEQAALAPATPPAAKTALQSVLELNQIEQQLLGMYRDLTPEQQNDLLQHANALYAKTHPDPSPANPFPGAAKRKRGETAKEEP